MIVGDAVITAVGVMTGVTDGDPVGIAVTVIEGVASTGMSGDSPPGAASAGPASGDEW